MSLGDTMAWEGGLGLDWQWKELSWTLDVTVYGYEKISDLHNALERFAVISDHSIEYVGCYRLEYSKQEGYGPGWMTGISLHCYPPGDWDEDGGEEARANIPDIRESLEEAFGTPSDTDLRWRWKKYSAL